MVFKWQAVGYTYVNLKAKVSTREAKFEVIGTSMVSEALGRGKAKARRSRRGSAVTTG